MQTELERLEDRLTDELALRGIESPREHLHGTDFWRHIKEGEAWLYLQLVQDENTLRLIMEDLGLASAAIR